MKKLILVLAVIASVTAFAQQHYTFDKNHARLTFSVLHFGISHVEGSFTTFNATLKSSAEDFSDAVVMMTADAKSVNTGVDMRDKDLRSNNWFDAAKYPELTFKSTSFKKVSGNHYKLEGDLTIHGITKLATFDVIYNGKAQNPFTKKSSVGFTVSGKLNRTDFKVGDGPSSKVVGEDIDVTANVEFIVE